MVYATLLITVLAYEESQLNRASDFSSFHMIFASNGKLDRLFRYTLWFESSDLL